MSQCWTALEGRSGLQVGVRPKEGLNRAGERQSTLRYYAGNTTARTKYCMYRARSLMRSRCAFVLTTSRVSPKPRKSSLTQCALRGACAHSKCLQGTGEGRPGSGGRGRDVCPSPSESVELQTRKWPNSLPCLLQSPQSRAHIARPPQCDATSHLLLECVLLFEAVPRVRRCPRTCLNRLEASARAGSANTRCDACTQAHDHLLLDLGWTTASREARTTCASVRLAKCSLTQRSNASACASCSACTGRA